METGTRGKIKIYMVLLLAVVFVAVGYFRFFYNKKKSGLAEAAIPSEIQLTVPELTPPGSSLDGKPGAPVTTRRPRVIRDIFSPGEFALASKTAEEKPKRSAPPSFSLKGTIVAGRQPIAVINNRFVRAGDRIEGYLVVKIDKKNVWLKSGSHRVKVETMAHE